MAQNERKGLKLCLKIKFSDSLGGEQVKTTPAWFFVEDEASARNMAKTVSDDITAAGGQAWVEVLEGTNHKTASEQMRSDAGIKGYGIYDWMVSVKKKR